MTSQLTAEKVRDLIALHRDISNVVFTMAACPTLLLHCTGIPARRGVGGEVSVRICSDAERWVSPPFSTPFL